MQQETHTPSADRKLRVRRRRAPHRSTARFAFAFDAVATREALAPDHREYPAVQEPHGLLSCAEPLIRL